MNKTFKFLSVTALLSVVAFDATARTTPTFVARSQGFDGPRQNAGTVGHTGLYGMDEFYGTLSVTPFYSRSFRSKDITECLFGTLLDEGDCKGRAIKVEGSGVDDRDNTTSWAAEYFYLPSDFESTLTFDPKIQNAGVDLHFWMGLDEWCNGLYFSLYAPIVWTKWDLGFKEVDITGGSATVPAGVISPTAVARTALLENFAAYASGTTPADITDQVLIPGDIITVKRQALQNAKICPKSDTSKVAVADLRAKLGWNFYNEEDWHIGFNIQAAAPTGTKRKAEFAFEPVVGNGNKWELGGGLSAHYTFWRSDDEEKSFGLYVDGNVTHLFKSSEQRTFDLKNKPASRYMLAQKMTTDTASIKFGLAGPNGTPVATAQFANEFAPIANLTTLNVDVSIGAQGNINTWFNYQTGGLGWDFGYNFYGRSCEKIKIDENCPNQLRDATWVLAGTGAQLFGFAQAGSGNITAGSAIPLAVSQSSATLTNPAVTIDSSTLATALGTGNNPDGTAAARINLVTTPGSMTQVSFSQPVVAITQPTDCENLNQGSLDLGGTRNMTHTVWTNLQWTWDREGWVPYLGLGGSVEFSRNNHEKACPTTTPTSSNSCPKSDCLDCGLSQWEIWLKAGISFN